MTAALPLAQRWIDSLKDDAVMYRLPGADGRAGTLVRRSAVNRRVLKIAGGLREELGLVAGDRVGVLVSDTTDIAFLLHATCVAELTLIPIPLSSSDDVLVSILNNTAVRTVICSVQAVARLATLIARLPGVRHWVLSGGGRSAALSQLGVKRLDDLIVNATPYTPLPSEKGGEMPALVLLTRGSVDSPAGVAFAQEQLLAGVELLVQVVGGDASAVVWSILPPSSLPSIQAHLLLPLISHASACHEDKFDPAEFWDTIRSFQITSVILDEVQLRAILRRGKSRRWVPFERLNLIVIPRGRLPARLVESVRTTFGVSVVPTYWFTEAGGLVTAALENVSAEGGPLDSEGDLVRLPASTGSALNGSSVEIVNAHGALAAFGERGEIVVHSLARMLRYEGTTPGAVMIGSHNSLHTGDEGVLEQSSSGKVILRVFGRAGTVIERPGGPVDLALIEATSQSIPGITFARAARLSNGEVGMFVVLDRRGAISANEILKVIREQLGMNSMPGRIVVGDPGDMTEALSQAEVIQRLERAPGS